MWQVLWKIEIFYVLCKKTKKISRATRILAPKISFLHTTQKKKFSHKTTL
jgi:hypothetical protein